MAKNKKILLWSVYSFMYIFQPNLLGIQTANIMFAVTVLLIGYYFFKNGELSFSSNMIWVFIGFLPFFLYFSIQMSMILMNHPSNQSAYLTNIRTTLFPFLHIFLSSILIQQLNKFESFDYSDFEKIIFISCAMQFVCVVLALLSNGIRQTFIAIMMRDFDASRIRTLMESSSDKRMYGLANNLFDSFAYLTSIMITMVFTKGVVKRNTKYIAVALVFLLIPLLNARTGLVLCAVCFSYVLLSSIKIKNIGIYIISAVAVIILAPVIISFLPSNTVEWVGKGYEETYILLTEGKKTGVYVEILGKDIVYPQNMWIGAGGNPEQLYHYHGIDSGYIQCLWRFGIVGTALLLLGYGFILVKVYRITNTAQVKKLMICVMLIILVYLFKLYPFANIGANFILFSIANLQLCQNNQKNEIRYDRLLSYVSPGFRKMQVVK